MQLSKNEVFLLPEEVSNRQLFFILVITVMGFSVIELPKTMAQTAGTGAWLSLLLAAIIFSILAAIMAYLGTLFKGMTLFEYSQLLVGKPVAYLITSIYTLYFLTILAMLNRSAAEIIRIDLLFKTPQWDTMLVMLIFSGYAASKGVINVGRILEYFGSLILLIAICIHFAMLTQGELLNIQPFFDATELPKYFAAIPVTILSFLGIEVITILPLSNENAKKTILYVIWAELFVGLLYILITESTYMLLGVEDAKNYKDVLVVAIRRLDISQLQFLKRLDIFFFMSWLFALFSTFTVLAYTVSAFFKKLFPRFKSPWHIFFVLLLTYIIGLLPPTYDSATQILSFTTKYLALFPAGIVPILLLIIAKVKKYET